MNDRGYRNGSPVPTMPSMAAMDELIGRAAGGQTHGNWLKPREETQSVIRYLETIRDRWRLVLLATAIAALAALFYVALAPRVYKAEADLLITPVANDDTTTSGLGLITVSSDPTQDVSTAARLASTPAVAAAAKLRLKSSQSPEAILADVTVEPVAQSNLIAIVAQAGTAADATRLANAFAGAVVQVRTRQLHDEITTLLPRLRAQLQKLPSREQTGPGSLGERISGLEALGSGSDPTTRLAAPAAEPASPASPRPKLAIAAGIIGGLIIGLGVAFASQALDPRLRREEQLRELFRLPLLARIPKLHNMGSAGPLTPGELTPAATEAYRTLRATLVATLGDARRSVLVTSSAPGEAKTTTAINIAHSFAHAGYRVVLIEGDMRRPTIADALNIRPRLGIGAVLIKRAELEEALVTTRQYGKNLRFLLVERVATALAEQLSLPTARELVADAEAIADIVIIDSPPLTEVVDALPLAQEVGGVLVMARLGTSRLNRLAHLGEMLQQGGVTPVGIAVVGVERAVEPTGYTSPDPVDAPDR